MPRITARAGMPELFFWFFLGACIVFAVSEIPRYGRVPDPGTNTYFFNGRVYTDDTALFRDIENMGAGQSLYRMEFAYEDYLYAVPESLRQYNKIVTILSVVHGSVQELPDWIGELTRLEHLILVDQPIRRLPSAIGSLTSLKSLKISGGKLKNIPREIGILTSLQILRIADNSLESIPEEIGALRKVEILDLHGNTLHTIPDSISDMSSLRYLYIGGNEIPQDEITKFRTKRPDVTVFD